jgi:predicted anti-sigma-YlaC factor YlaD
MVVTSWRRSLDIHKDSGGYVLHALSRREYVAFERHLRDCRPCVDQVGEFRRTIFHLASDIVITPPASLRSRLLAQSVRRTAWKIPRLDQSNRA